MKGHRKWTIAKDGLGEWRWQCKAANGRIILAATEGYKRRIAAVNNARKGGAPLALRMFDAVQVKV